MQDLPDRTIHSSILEFRGYRYLKLALVLIVAGIIGYLVEDPPGGRSGDSWAGYTLGIVSALLIVWLAWFGIRKRRHGRGRLMLEDWLSAHVYLGLSLIVLATLHTGFEFALNIHTLAYALMLLVIVTGIYGIWVYMGLPGKITDNRDGAALDDMMREIAEAGRECQEAALELGGEYVTLIDRANAETRIGGGMWRQLSGRDPSCPTAAALDRAGDMARALSGNKSPIGQRLVSALTRRAELLARARRDIRYRALLKVWLIFHIPLTVGLLAALIAHIVSVFYYW